MGKTRTPLGKFVHTKWVAMKIRCGHYPKCMNLQKSKYYINVKIEFTREEFKDWCKSNWEKIINLKRPSIDRIDKNKNYSIDNIQVIELSDNIRKDKLKAKDGKCECYRCKEIKILDEFALDKRRINNRSTLCKLCSRDRRKKQT